MNVFEAMGYADIALTLAMMALVVGCPTGIVTYIVVRQVVTQTVKWAGRKAIASAAGATATIAASLLSMNDKGLGGQDGFSFHVGQAVLDQTTSRIMLQQDSRNAPHLLLDGSPMMPNEALSRLLVQATQGSLQRIHVTNRLGSGHGEWVLKVHQIGSVIPDVAMEWTNE